MLALAAQTAAQNGKIYMRELMCGGQHRLKKADFFSKI